MDRINFDYYKQVLFNTMDKEYNRIQYMIKDKHTNIYKDHPEWTDYTAYTQYTPRILSNLFREDVAGLKARLKRLNDEVETINEESESVFNGLIQKINLFAEKTRERR